MFVGDVAVIYTPSNVVDETGKSTGDIFFKATLVFHELSLRT